MHMCIRKRPLHCRAFLLVAVLLFCSVSCATSRSVETKNSPEGLMAVVKAFNTSFRWGEYRSAAAFVPMSQQARFWDRMDLFSRKLRIADFEIRQANTEIAGSTGAAIISYRFYTTSDPKLQTKTIEQKWYHQEKEKTWKVVDDGFDALLQDRQ
jgi:hypothetical protein